MKGGNVLFLVIVGVRKLVNFDFNNYFNFVLCIILKLKYLIFKIDFIVGESLKVFMVYIDFELYFYFYVL